MASLMELVERVNKGELIDAEHLEVYEESPNSAEKFLAHHAHAMLDLRQAQHHMLQSLEAIEYSDQKVLNQFLSVSSFVGVSDMRAPAVVKFGSCAIGRREYALGVEAMQNGVAFDLAHGGAYTSDRENCLFVATQYDRAAQCAGWRAPDGAPASLDYNNKQTKIAYLVSAVADDEASARVMCSLARHIDQKRFKFQVYSTEAGVRRHRFTFTRATSQLASMAAIGSACVVSKITTSTRSRTSWLASSRAAAMTSPSTGAVHMGAFCRFRYSIVCGARLLLAAAYALWAKSCFSRRTPASVE